MGNSVIIIKGVVLPLSRGIVSYQSRTTLNGRKNGSFGDKHCTIYSNKVVGVKDGLLLLWTLSERFSYMASYSIVEIKLTA